MREMDHQDLVPSGSPACPFTDTKTQILVTVKDNVITVRPNLQEGTLESNGFSVRTADLKNGFGFSTELNRDDYVNDIVEKITRIVNG